MLITTQNYDDFKTYTNEFKTHGTSTFFWDNSPNEFLILSSEENGVGVFNILLNKPTTFSLDFPKAIQVTTSISVAG